MLERGRSTSRVARELRTGAYSTSARRSMETQQPALTRVVILLTRFPISALSVSAAEYPAPAVSRSTSVPRAAEGPNDGRERFEPLTLDDREGSLPLSAFESDERVDATSPPATLLLLQWGRERERKGSLVLRDGVDGSTTGGDSQLECYPVLSMRAHSVRRRPNEQGKTRTVAERWKGALLSLRSVDSQLIQLTRSIPMVSTLPSCTALS